eukprot:15015848-Alexandrium_andersonii.AAC.1
MSASLVGSEMCIRDSRCCRRASSEDAESLDLPVWIAGASLYREGSGGAVSYTHLTLPTICSV